jgi:hypothetical protein
MDERRGIQLYKRTLAASQPRAWGNSQGNFIDGTNVYIYPINLCIRSPSPIRTFEPHYAMVGGNITVRPISRIYVLYYISLPCSSYTSNSPNTCIPELGWHPPWFRYLSLARLMESMRYLHPFLLYANTSPFRTCNPLDTPVWGARTSQPANQRRSHICRRELPASPYH